MRTGPTCKTQEELSRRDNPDVTQRRQQILMTSDYHKYSRHSPHNVETRPLTLRSNTHTPHARRSRTNSRTTIGSNFTGDVLGEEQWEWLESELVHDGGVNIIVSSIQVLTTNPLVESWGHFPKEKRKFLELLDSSKTKTIVLSGDVHHAEFSKVGDIVEITSSGLTHSCSGPFYGFVCDIMLRTFEQHRLEGFYWVKENFGVLRIQEGEVGVEVFDGEGNVVGETRVGEREGGIVWEEVPQLLDGRVSWNFVGFVGGLLLVAVVVLRILIGFVGRWRKKKKNSKKKIS